MNVITIVLTGFDEVRCTSCASRASDKNCPTVRYNVIRCTPGDQINRLHRVSGCELNANFEIK